MKIEIDKRFRAKLEGRFAKYDLEVGVLADAPHMKPKTGARGLKGQDVISKYAGGPVRQKTRTPSDKTISEVSAANRDRLGFNYLAKPFKERTSEIMKFSVEFLKLAFRRGETKRCENLLQAIVRNPILRGEYGSNSPLTQKIKGFDRSMIDTAQLFKAIRAKVRMKNG